MADVASSFTGSHDGGPGGGTEGGDGGAATNLGAGRDPALGAGMDSPDGRDARGRAVYGDGARPYDKMSVDEQTAFRESEFEGAYHRLDVRQQSELSYSGLGAPEVTAAARYAYSTFEGDPQLANVFTDPKVGNNPRLIRAAYFASVGEKILNSADPLAELTRLRPEIRGRLPLNDGANRMDNRQGGAGAGSRDSLIDEADRLMERGDYFRDKRAQRRVSEIYSQVYGTGGPDAAGNYNDR